MRKAKGTVASELMSAPVITIPATASIAEAVRVMMERSVKRLPVVDDGQVVGLVSQRDLCGVLAALGSDADLVEIPADDLVRSRRAARLEGKGPR